MRGWRCRTCGQVVFLDSSQCLRCGAALGFRPSTLEVEPLTRDERICSTAATSGCTWIVEEAGHDRCVACGQVVLVPPLDDPDVARCFRQASDDHRHLVVQLLELGLPVTAVDLRLPSSRYDDQVTIGHVDGVVTIDVDEADDVQREQVRHSLGEEYRTVLGHLRHEYGHALFPHVVDDDALARVRATFGDEREDYQAALDRHYDEGPPPGWQRTHVSAYATMHPSEDWAETFAHVLHITDVLRAADAFGLRLDPDGLAATALPSAVHARRALVDGDGDAGDADVDYVDGQVSPTGPRPLGETPMRALLQRFVPIAFALNEVTRAMGEGDLYPFVLTEDVAVKLELAAELVGIGPDRG